MRETVRIIAGFTLVDTSQPPLVVEFLQQSNHKTEIIHNRFVATNDEISITMSTLALLDNF